MSEVITGRRNPVAALGLNLCIPGIGVGYFYMGQWIKGVGQIILTLMGGIGLIWWVISWFDVYAQTSILDDGGTIEQLTFFSASAHIHTPQSPHHHPAPKPASDQVSQVVHDVGKEIEGILDKAKTPPSIKVCLSCGQQIDVRYMVCPYCQAPVTGGKQPESGVVEY